MVSLIHFENVSAVSIFLCCGGDPSWEITYAVFARNLSDGVREIAPDEKDVLAFTPDDVFGTPRL